MKKQAGAPHRRSLPDPRLPYVQFTVKTLLPQTELKIFYWNRSWQVRASAVCSGQSRNPPVANYVIFLVFGAF